MHQARIGAAACAALALALATGGVVVASMRASSASATSISATADPRRYPVGMQQFAPSQRQALPALAGVTLDGSRLAVSSLRGHVVVLNVWASWCAPCQSESPALARVAAHAAARGDPVRFVGLDENDTSVAATAFLASVGSTYPHLVDGGSLLAQLSSWLPPAVPGSLVVDPDGKVAARIVGPVTADQLQTALAAVRAA